MNLQKYDTEEILEIDYHKPHRGFKVGDRVRTPLHYEGVVWYIAPNSSVHVIFHRDAIYSYSPASLTKI